LHQMIFYFGRETLKEGLKTYFSKYREKNATLSDFVRELSSAAKKYGVIEDEQFMIDWTDQWLKTAGCALIELDYTSVDGKLTGVSVKQTPYNLKNTPDNRLRD
jgi:aminopeptidase N